MPVCTQASRLSSLGSISAGVSTSSRVLVVRMLCMLPCMSTAPSSDGTVVKLRTIVKPISCMRTRPQ